MRAHFAYIPDVAQPRHRLPLHLSQRWYTSLISTPTCFEFSIRPRRFVCTRLHASYLTNYLRCLFRRRSPRRLFTCAAQRWFGTNSYQPIPRGLLSSPMQHSRFYEAPFLTHCASTRQAFHGLPGHTGHPPAGPGSGHATEKRNGPVADTAMPTSAGCKSLEFLAIAR